MITQEKIHFHQQQDTLDQLFEGCLCGGDDFGVFYIDNVVYKIHHYNGEEGYEKHPDYEILSDLNNHQFFPKVIDSGLGYVCMTYEDGMFWNEYLEVERHIPPWANQLLKEAISYTIDKGYDPIELEPRHVLIDDKTNSIKIIDVTAYEKIPLENITKGYKEELFHFYLDLFK